MRILFLDLDTLRPDRLGCYGYHRDTSPNLDRLAAEATRFTGHYCSDAPCLPSRAGLVTGQFGIHSGIVGHGGSAADLCLQGAARGFRDRLDRASLWNVCRQAGLHTASISTFAERHSAWWFNAGFNECHNVGQGGMESAEHVTPVALDWIARNAARDNWMLHLNYWDPHTPYRAPAAFGNPFANDPLPAWPDAAALAAHRGLAGPHKPREINMFDAQTSPRFPRHPGELRDQDDLRRMQDGYDCGIRYMDDHLGRVFDALRRAGVWDDLAIVVTADHGENMGELGIYGEHATADAVTPHIPLIIRWPGAARGQVDHGLHYQLDLAPTFAELLGVPAHPSWDGRSFAATLRNGTPTGRDHLVLGQCAHVCQRGVRFENWMYVRTWHDGFHLFPDEMLFDLATDPCETRDLAGARADIVGHARGLLERWHAAMMATQPDAVDPLWTVLREGGPFHTRGRLPAYARRLEETERAPLAAALRKRHPGECAKPDNA